MRLGRDLHLSGGQAGIGLAGRVAVTVTVSLAALGLGLVRLYLGVAIRVAVTNNPAISGRGEVLDLLDH